MDQRPPDWIESLKIERIQHRDFVFDNWPTDEPDSQIEKVCETITDEYRIRKSLPKSDRQYVSPLKWLKPVCYNAILTFLHYDLFSCLETRIGKFGRLKRGAQTERSIFTIGLVGIFAHDVPKAQLVGTKKVLTPALTTEKERERMAEEMRWGFRHYVTPAELVAFNRKHPLHKADPPMPREYILDEFHETIIARRVDEEALGMRVEEERGGYPEKIERAVEARQIEHWDALRIRSNVFDPDWD